MKVPVIQYSTKKVHYINVRRKIRVYQFGVGHYLPVRVNGKVIQTVNPRTKNWPKVGEHNPALEAFRRANAGKYFSNLPEGFVEP